MRGQVFDRIIGQETAKETLLRSMEQGRLSHAYLIAGEEGSGRKSLAEAFAAWLLCEDPKDGPCGACRSCRMMSAGSHPDFKRVRAAKATGLGVGEIRQQVVEDMLVRPYAGAYKIYLIEEADRMTPEAQNALLKTLEEPPEYGMILLIASREEGFLPTILSRCVTLHTVPVPEEAVEEALAGEDMDEGRRRFLARISQGYIGRALELARDPEKGARLGRVLSFLRRISRGDANDMLAFAEYMKDEKKNIGEILNIIELWYADVLVFKATKDIDSLLFTEDLQAIVQAANTTSFPGIDAIFGAVRKMRDRLYANVNFDLAAELLLFTIKESIA